ncbi:MAG: MFS transporter [Deltaproteobacteria bacterium]|nr:MFS transporter [Deltaproteobacteria bacterium]
MIQRLAPLGFVYAAYYAGVVGTLSLWLPARYRDLGATGTQMGFLLSMGSLAACGVPFAVGRLADWTRRPVFVLRASLLMGSVAMLVLARAETLAIASVSAVAMSISLCSVPTLTDSLTLEAVDRSAEKYGRVRSLGSLGYVLATAGYPIWTSSAPEVAVGLVVLGLASACTARSGASERVSSAGAGPGAVARLISDRRLMALLLVFSLHWAAVGPYHSFLPIVTSDLGFSDAAASRAFALAATAEIAGMWLVRGPPGPWLLVTFALSSLRWLLTGTATSETSLLAVQLLHGFTFGAFVTAAQKLVVARVPQKLRATGQGLFFSVVFGVGGGLGTIASGVSYEALGGRAIFVGAAILELVAAAALLLTLGPRLTDQHAE